MLAAETPLTLDDLRAAAARIAPLARRTDVLTSRRLNEWLGCEGDSACNACGQCLDEEGSDIATCLVSLDCGDVINQPATSAMVECACGGDLGDCFGPCAAPCGLAPD